MLKCNTRPSSLINFNISPCCAKNLVPYSQFDLKCETPKKPQ